LRTATSPVRTMCIRRATDRPASRPAAGNFRKYGWKRESEAPAMAAGGSEKATTVPDASNMKPKAAPEASTSRFKTDRHYPLRRACFRRPAKLRWWATPPAPLRCRRSPSRRPGGSRRNELETVASATHCWRKSGRQRGCRWFGSDAWSRERGCAWSVHWSRRGSFFVSARSLRKQLRFC
jgi:hypothetical protein